MKRGHNDSSHSSPASSRRQKSHHRSTDPVDISPLLSFGISSQEVESIDCLDMAFVKGRLGGLNDILKQLHLARSKANESQHKLSALKKKIKEDPSCESSSTRQKLSDLYRNALKDSETESELTRKTLDTIFQIRSQARASFRKQEIVNCIGKNVMRKNDLMKILSDNANMIPLFVAKTPTEKPPPLCSSIPVDDDYICKMGDLVIAFANWGDETWILAEVFRYHSSTQMYEVDDIDSVDSNGKGRHTLPKKLIIPIPKMRANPLTHPKAFYPKDAEVLALYPRTTCFYKAIVVEPPRTLNGTYKVVFEDNTCAHGWSVPMEVVQRYVVPYRNGKKLK